MSSNQQSKSKTDQSRSLPKTNEQSALRFYQGGRLATEVGTQGNRSLMWGSEMAVAQRDGAQEAHLLQTDLPGSVLGMQQAMLRSMAYSPYGYRAANETGALLGFNGQRPEPVAGGYLLGNGHRLFSPTLMRFCGADSLSPFEEGGLNAYAYCEGDPINYGDPSGQTLSLVINRLLNFKNFFRTNNAIQFKNPQPNTPSGSNYPTPSGSTFKNRDPVDFAGRRSTEESSTPIPRTGAPTGKTTAKGIIENRNQRDPHDTRQSNIKPLGVKTEAKNMELIKLRREVIAVDKNVFHSLIKQSFVTRHRKEIIVAGIIGVSAVATTLALLGAGVIPDPFRANKDVRS